MVRPSMSGVNDAKADDGRNRRGERKGRIKDRESYDGKNRRGKREGGE